MAKYRTTSIALIATDIPYCGKQFQFTVTGVNVDNDKDVATFTDDIGRHTASYMCDIYFNRYWADEVKFFNGEYVEVELPNREKATVFCCYGIDEDTGDKYYCQGHSPCERMCQLWVQLQTEASQAQPATHADTTNR